MKLSFVIPYYRRLPWFRLALAHNVSVFSQPETEVVLVLDDPHEKDDVVAEALRFPQIKWRILMCGEEHEWRPPCKAMNLGIRNALGINCAYLCPESVLLMPSPSFAQDYTVGAAYYGGLCWIGNNLPLYKHFSDFNISPTYGFILAPTRAFKMIHGYDESRKEWGGDDDDIRWRFQENGWLGVLDYRFRILNFHHGADYRKPDRNDVERVKLFINQPEWGTTPHETLYDWAKA